MNRPTLGPGRAERHDRRAAALDLRMRSVLLTLTGPPAAGSPALTSEQLRLRLAAELSSDRPDVLWLTLAAVTATLPTTDEVLTACRACDFDGPVGALEAILASARPESRLRAEWAPVTIAVGTVLVDLHHTSRTELATGIQRVARQAARRWRAANQLTIVGWTDSFSRIRELAPDQAANALYGSRTAGTAGLISTAGAPGPGGSISTAGATAIQPVLVPWESTYLLPELMTERDRALRLAALVSYSRCHSGAIGFDCVPLTSAETIGEGMGAAFAVNLTAIARMSRVATISEAAAVEYRGWRSMLGGAGLAGPDIEAIPLAVEASAPSTAAVAEVRRQLCVGTVPMVLVVGSHEPRKNHLAVLHAAEVLWREGLRFSLAFVGGNSWNSSRFQQRIAELRSVARPVESVSALSEDMLWAAYSVAHCVLFPSLNEGFGLPVAEALASGTPVITSGFGSMAEIADAGGALLVDPADDEDLTRALRRLLTEPELHARLVDEAKQVTVKTWDSYASEVWDSLVVHGDGPVHRLIAADIGSDVAHRVRVQDGNS